MDKLGRYRIACEIGRGAMGIVYRADDPAIGRTVAIKTIRLGDLADQAERAKLHERLFREAQSAGMLSHPGIVTIYDVAEENDIAYIAMEFVDGLTLDRMLIQDPPDAKLVLSILSQTAAALDYAHKRGIVHRDIKPANIMIHERTTAKIMDFGVARIESHQMTQAGGLIGTPNYMSPEQIQGDVVTGRSDQFSLAVIGYELLTGEKPFVADSIPALVFKVVKEDAAPVHHLNASLTWAVDTVIKRALSKDPDARYPTCSDFVFALENACRSAKAWQPIAPGVLQDLPTLVPPAARRERVRSDAPTAPLFAVTSERSESVTTEAPSEELEPAGDRKEVPAVLRLARVLAVITLIGGLLAVAVVGGLEYLSDDNGGTAAVVDETDPASRRQPERAPTASGGRTTFQSTNQGQSQSSSVTSRPGERVAPALPKDVERAEASEVRPAGPAEVRMVTNPPGASIVVDNDPSTSCTSPCSLTLRPGRHTIAATREGFRRTLRIFESPRETEIFLNLDRTTGTVLVSSTPAGASISVDGRERSEKTPAVLVLPTGSHSIEVVQGSQRETRQVAVQDSVATAVTFNLE